MYLIIGLGNPEEEYGRTRHNMGFNVINKLSNKYGIEVNKKKFDGLCGDGIIEGGKVILLKPQTYMNLSGISVKKFKDFFKIEGDKIIIIHDDIDTEVGKIRIRKTGGAGTHNGMKSIVSELSGKAYERYSAD